MVCMISLTYCNLAAAVIVVSLLAESEFIRRTAPLALLAWASHAPQPAQPPMPLNQHTH
jgi:hypothetical protein